MVNDIASVMAGTHTDTPEHTAHFDVYKYSDVQDMMQDLQKLIF